MSNSRITTYCLLFLLSLFTTEALSQKSKNQLEKEKNENLQRITEAEKILKNTENQKKTTLGQLSAINHQIKSREALIGSIREEIDWYERKIQDDIQVIESLNEDLSALKDEYSAMVYAGYKASRNQDKLTFLFSSVSFNQFLMRLKYFEQYGESRRYQAEQIMKVEEVLRDEMAGFAITKGEQEILLQEEIQERDKLGSLIEKQKIVIADLSKKENQLRKELTKRREAVDELETLISNIIKEEMKAKKVANTSLLATMSTSFAGNKQHLPWPVNEGFISSGFGKHNHPVYKRVVIDNKGVYIQTNPDEKIKAVFSGKVSAVVNIPGMNKAVIIQHGEYRTVYANLKQVNVAMNQEVATSDMIGEVYTENDGDSELFFQIWKNTNILNPQQWLTKK